MSDTRLDEYFICGGFGGICAILVGHPFDTIKVRLQTMPMPKPGETALYTGPWNCFQKSIKTEGFSGLFKGMSLPLTIVTPIFAISFLSYGIGKQIFGPSDDSRLTLIQLFAAGSISGLFSSFLTAPGERIKCLLQIQRDINTPNVYKGPIDCATKIYKLGGLPGMFRGIGATIIREVPSSGIYFLTYETMRERISVDNSELSKNLRTIMAGGTAGVAYWITGLPADILKSKIQTASEKEPKPKIRKVFKQLLNREGPRGLYKGMTPVLIRAFVANSACFLGFDFFKRFLDFLFTKHELVSSNDVRTVAHKK